MQQHKTIEAQNLFTCDAELGEKKNPRKVLLVGAPGIGKTTCCHTLVTDIFNHRLFQDQTIVPYLIRLRDLTLLEDAISFREILVENHGPQYGPEEAWQTEVWKLLQQNEERLVIFLDGWDENPALNDPNIRPSSNALKMMTPEKAIKSLIDGSILPNAKLFITSRPHAVQTLVKNVDRCFELEGLDMEKLKELCSRSLDSDSVNLVIEYLERHPRIRGLCYIPRHAKCFIDYVKFRASTKQKYSDIMDLLPRTIASLFFCIVITLLEESCSDLKENQHSEHLEDLQILGLKKEFLLKVGKLALYGLKNNKPIFTEQDLKDSGCNLTIEEAGQNIMGSYTLPWRDTTKVRERRYLSFPHHTVMEFSSATQLVQVCNMQCTTVHCAQFLEIIESVSTSQSLQYSLHYCIFLPCLLFVKMLFDTSY